MSAYTAILALLGVLVLQWANCEVYRLPKNIKPLRYFLTLEPFLRDLNLSDPILFNGSVTIEFKVLEKTASVVLHQKDLNILNNSIDITTFGKDKLKLNFTTEDQEVEIYTIQFQEELLENATYNITINFNGTMGASKGFFKAFYYDKNNKTRVLAATQFQQISARRAFPCFDEPSLKAKFVVSLIRKEGYNSVSNEELESTEDLGDGRFKDTFKETPLMSTFTLAFAISDYKASKKSDRITIYARPEAIDEGEFDYALDVSVKTLSALEEYTGMKFEMSKMDEIGIPDFYFRHHAMENWGLVVYRESYLLHTNESSAKDLQKTACIIAHEFAHQWFGNLVTPEWWEYIWLAESFAVYFGYHIADVVQPSWRLKDQFVIDIVTAALRNEEFDGPYPLNYPISYSGQYPPYHVMYEKGATVVRMMEHFLTPDIFRKGLQIFLTNRKFKTAVPSDLYSALQEAVDRAGMRHLLNDMPLEKIMKTWDTIGGFPHIAVTRNYTSGDVTIRQNYLMSKVNTSTKWIIPFNYVWCCENELDFSNTTAEFWLTEESVTKNFNKTDGWILLNKQFTGYYRIQYDLENWNRIIDFLNSDNYTSIHVLNRAQLISDAFFFGQIGFVSLDVPLRLCEYLIRETDYTALAAFYDSVMESLLIYEVFHDFEVAYLDKYTSSKGNRTHVNAFKEYLRTVLSGVYDRLGTEPKPTDTHLDRIHRDKFLKLYQHLV